MVVEAGKTEESVIRTLPPFERIGSCSSIRWLNRFGAGPASPSWSCASAPGFGPGKM
ncbi:hypothetical protein CHKEEEPN_3753 [Methylorubrum podarium]|nr:hypothetical protein CHKEEEPN_3753 [Methylorubrum podarium]